MKYNSPLATTASPDEATTGSRRNCTALFAIDAMLHDVGGGGESDMAEEEPEVEDGLLGVFLRKRTTLTS